MVAARVENHGCDTWTVFRDFSTFKQSKVIDSSMLFNSLMSNFNIIVLLIFV